jgi:hypothetical protein
MCIFNICFDRLRKTMKISVTTAGLRLWKREFTNTKLSFTKSVEIIRSYYFQPGRYEETNGRILANFSFWKLHSERSTGDLNQHTNKCQFHHLRDSLNCISFLSTRSPSHPSLCCHKTYELKLVKLIHNLAETVNFHHVMGLGIAVRPQTFCSSCIEHPTFPKIHMSP